MSTKLYPGEIRTTPIALTDYITYETVVPMDTRFMVLKTELYSVDWLVLTCLALCNLTVVEVLISPMMMKTFSEPIWE